MDVEEEVRIEARYREAMRDLRQATQDLKREKSDDLEDLQRRVDSSDDLMREALGSKT